MEIKYLQTFFKNAGAGSCYCDIIIKIACDINKIPYNLQNIGKAFDVGFDQGFVTFNQNNYADEKTSFFVKNPTAWLKCLTGKNYDVIVKDRNYIPTKDEIEVDFYTLSEENGANGIGHFVMPNYDPILGSNTKKNGFIYSKRIFRRR